MLSETICRFCYFSYVDLSKGMSLAVNVNRKPMLKMVNKAVNSIFHHPKDPFWSGRVMDYLFDGIEIDCTSEDFAAQAVCSVLDSGEAKIVQPLREGFYKFSVFGAVSLVSTFDLILLLHVCILKFD